MVQSVLVFKQSSSSCCSNFDIMRPAQHLTTDQQFLTIARLHTGCSQTKVAIELRVSQRSLQQVATVIQRDWKVTGRYRNGQPLATSHTDDFFIVNSALWNRMMNATQLQAYLSVTSDQSKPFTSVWFAC